MNISGLLCASYLVLLMNRVNIENDVFSEETDSNALNLVYDSNGDNSESFEESGPRPYQ